MEIGFRILWTDFAINQLKSIFDYHLIKASPNVAHKLVQKIIDATILLENNPQSGRLDEKKICWQIGIRNSDLYL